MIPNSTFYKGRIMNHLGFYGRNNLPFCCGMITLPSLIFSIYITTIEKSNPILLKTKVDNLNFLHGACLATVSLNTILTMQCSL